MPASPDTLAAYLLHLEELGRSWATIARRCATISKAHGLRGYEPPFRDPTAEAARRSVRNRLGVGGQRRVSALLPLHLTEGLPLLPGTPRGVRDASLLTLGLGGAFRRSELAALRLGDVVVVDRGLEVHVARGKTDQAGHGRDVFIWRGSRDLTCPALRWLAWQDLRGEAGPESPAFVRVLGNRLTEQPLDGRVVALAVKKLAHLVGEDPALFSGHSLRAGFVTAANRAGKSDVQIMRQTGHRCRAMLDRYYRPESGWVDNPSEGIGL